MAGDRGARARRLDPGLIGALVVGLGAFAVYRATLLPGMGAWDTAEAQTVPTVLGTMHPTGFPAYVLLGWLATTVLAPLGTPAFLMNAVSAVLVAAAVGLTVLVNRRLGVPVLVAMAAAAGFALSPVVWRLGTAADVHALHLLLLVGIVGLLLAWEARVEAWRADPDDARLRSRADRALVLAAAVFGVSLANHALTLLLIPAVGLFVLAVEPDIVRRPRVVLGALAACFGVAAILYLELPLRAGPFRAPLVYGHPETWSGFWEIVLARQFQGGVVRPLADVAGKVAALIAIAQQQFGWLLVLVPSGLLVAIVRRPRYALLSGVAVLVTCFFAASYENAAIERYYAGPAFFAWTWLAILGGAIVDAVAGRWRDAGNGDRPISWRRLLGAGTSLVVGVALLVPVAGVLPARWQSADQSSVSWYHRWLDETFETLAPDAVVISWWSYSTPMWYGQLVEHRRPDVWIVDDRTRLDAGLGTIPDVIEATLDSRPVYLIRGSPSEIAALSDRYVITAADRPGNLYRVVGRKEAP